MNFLCKNCAYLMTNGACPVAGYSPDPNQLACPNFSNIGYNCEICHIPLFHKQMVIDEQGKTYCDKCWAKLYSCGFCDLHTHCAFNDSPDTPKIIQKTETIGNIQTVRNIRNPDITEKTCKKGCVCFSEENGCLREINCCDKFIPIKN